MILADTDVLIDYLIGSQPAKDQVLAYIESDSLQTTAISWKEKLGSHDFGNLCRNCERAKDLMLFFSVSLW